MNCSLQQLNANVLLHASNLHSLELKNNQISALKERLTTKQNDKLNYIDLGSNKIVAINENVFEYLSELGHLILSNNKIVKLLKNVFRPLLNLQIISLDGNGIEFLDDDTFAQNAKLNKVFLHNNKLTMVNSKLFRSVRLLDTLDLSYNKLSNYTLEVPTKLLKVEFNQLKHLHIVNSITSVLASNNEINTLSCDSHDYMNVIETLELDYNNISNFNCIRSMMNLRDASLSHNSFVALSVSDFVNLYNLMILDLSYNKIRQINLYVLNNLDKLTTLSLAGNSLRKLDAEKIKLTLPELMTFEITGNDFTCTDLTLLTHQLEKENVHYPVDSPASDVSNVNGLPCRGKKPNHHDDEEVADVAANPKNSLNDLQQFEKRWETLFNLSLQTHAMNATETGTKLNTMQPLSQLNTSDGFSSIKTLFSLTLAILIIMGIYLFIIFYRKTVDVPSFRYSRQLSTTGSEMGLVLH